MLSGRRAVTELAAQLGADLAVDTYGAAGFRVSVWAPGGQVWVANGAHVIVSDNNEQGGATWSWRDAHERLRYGIMPCATPDCEVCTQ